MTCNPMIFLSLYGNYSACAIMFFLLRNDHSSINSMKLIALSAESAAVFSDLSVESQSKHKRSMSSGTGINGRREIAKKEGSFS